MCCYFFFLLLAFLVRVRDHYAKFLPLYTVCFLLLSHNIPRVCFHSVRIFLFGLPLILSARIFIFINLYIPHYFSAHVQTISLSILSSLPPTTCSSRELFLWCTCPWSYPFLSLLLKISLLSILTHLGFSYIAQLLSKHSQRLCELEPTIR